jgi:glycine/D-amino acid oxidase-like deaminating enzyme
MLSYWEKKHFYHADLIVIGSGFVGLSTAIHYKKKNPKSKVLVLERGIFPHGASTKNAGFACFGSLTEILDDLQSMSECEVLELVEKRYRGLNQIRKKFGDKALAFEPSNGFELLDERLLYSLDELGRVNELLRAIFREDVFSKVKRLEKFQFSDQIKAVIKNQFEGELDPGKYLDALWSMASQLGVRILTGVEVQEIWKDEGRILARNTQVKEPVEFFAKKIGVCTNAFTAQLLPGLDMKPGRGLILLSQKLDFQIPWKGSFHIDKGYVYFRQVDGRLLIGGGRNKDFKEEESVDFEVNVKIKRYLEDLASEVIFPNQEIKWEMEWTGIMAFGPKKSPILEQVGTHTFAAVRLGGMGVAIGWEVGKELSKLMG